VSFFDEVEEPRTSPRTQPRRRRPSGTGRRPPTDQQAIQVRRVVLAVVLLVVVVLIAVGVHSCQVSARNSSLKTYSNNVASLITQSNSTGSKLFQILSSGPTASNATSVQNSINQTRSSADDELSHAKNIDVPDEVKTANGNFLMTMQMRADALTDIASQIQPALGNQASKDAIYAIAAEMARLYASDVVYKNYATVQLARALHSAGIAVGGADGQPIAAGQFVPDVNWVTPAFIARELNVTLPGASGTSTGPIAPGLHGHELNSVSVSGTTLQTGSPNTIAASPAPTFTLNFTNSGTNNEQNVVCKVTVSGTSDSGQTTVPQTIAGKPATCKVTLKSAPSKGTATVVATIERVPGEKNVTNNSQSFPVTFQ
jgi:hypothetical protein